MVLFEEITKEQVAKLSKSEFLRQEPKTIHEELRLLNNGVTLIFYSSGKLLLQGKEQEVQEVAKHLQKLGFKNRVPEENFRKESGWIIGSDESLKGDTFGGIVVAAVKANEESREKLIQLGVKDSKKLEDKEVLRLAEEIKNIVECEIKSLLPEEYNHHNNLANVTHLLNTLHKHCGDYLKPGKHIVDKYPGCNVGNLQEEKAESKYVEVAAASILARAGALKQLSYLSGVAGFTLPKGSTHVATALQDIKDKRLDFRKFVKTDFKNVKEFL